MDAIYVKWQLATRGKLNVMCRHWKAIVGLLCSELPALLGRMQMRRSLPTASLQLDSMSRSPSSQWSCVRPSLSSAFAWIPK